MTTISVASYYSSGSSAITDFVSEYSTVKSLTDYEFRFVQDPDGLAELEFNLVQNFNRHNSGHALKRYKRLVDYYGKHFLIHRYEPFFQNEWKKTSYEYIDSLIDFSYQGCWQYDFFDRGSWFEFWNKLPDRILHRTIWRNKPDMVYCTHRMKKEITYGAHPTEDRFLKCTTNYTDKLFSLANPEKKPFLMVDQMLPSSNIKRYLRYFSDMKVIVVDRDPRDVFLQAKYLNHDPMVPSNVTTFCQWYAYARSTRKTEEWDPNSVCLIQFEDMIYRYKKTAKNISNWIGLLDNDHVDKLIKFNPSKSIKNTKIWLRNPKFMMEALQIKELLPEYIYPYEV